MSLFIHKQPCLSNTVSNAEAQISMAARQEALTSSLRCVHAYLWGEEGEE